ncbi:MAG: hypothetical protein V1855_03830 [bacterium]
MKKRIVQLQLFVLIMLASIYVCCAQESVQSFIIKKKSFQEKSSRKMSRRQLKEGIGDQTKEAFDITTKIGKEIGKILVNSSKLEKKKMPKMAKEQDPEKNKKGQPSFDFLAKVYEPMGSFQIHLCTLQGRFSKIVEHLVSNQRPFKGAEKDDLAASYQLMKRIHKDLSNQLTTLCSIQKNSIHFDHFSKQALTMQRCVDALQKLHADLNSDSCLKHV